MNAADLERFLAKRGETVTLRREGAPNVDVDVKAYVRELQADELVGDLKQIDRRIIISNGPIADAAWPGPPLINDRVIRGGKTYSVLLPGTRKIGEAVVGHWMIVRG